MKGIIRHFRVCWLNLSLTMWDEFLDTNIYAYNTSVHESTAFTPFELMYSRKAFLPIDIEIDDKGPEELIEQLSKDTGDAQAVQEITRQRLEKLEVAKNNIKKAQEKQKEIFDRNHACPNPFLVGVKVLKKDMRRKVDERYTGPYIITKCYGKGIYSLQEVADPSNVI